MHHGWSITSFLLKPSVVLVKLAKDQFHTDAYSYKMKHAENYCTIKTLKAGQAVSLDLYQTYNYVRGQTLARMGLFLPYHSITLGQRTYCFKESHQNYRLCSSNAEIFTDDMEGAN